MTARQRLRRGIAVAILLAQLGLIVSAYDADHAFFGFQMFPEASEWEASIDRVLADGTRVDIREPWPGGYRWGDLVSGRGLGSPFTRQHADTGLRSTLHFFEAALEWVAANTPADTETVALEAAVTVWKNGGEPQIVQFEATR